MGNILTIIGPSPESIDKGQTLRKELDGAKKKGEGMIRKEPPETAKAYLAGLIDGEGCITVLRRKIRKAGLEYITYEPHVIIAMTDREPLDFVREVYPGMLTSYKPKNPKHRRGYRYMAKRESARRMTKELEPYLIIKKKQAKLIQKFPFTHRGMPRSTQSEIEQQQIYERLKTLNMRGPKNQSSDDIDFLNKEMQLSLFHRKKEKR